MTTTTVYHPYQSRIVIGELHARIAELESQLTLARQRADAAAEERDALRWIVNWWAIHTSDCKKTPRYEYGEMWGAALRPAPCTCGLDNALAALRASDPRGPA